jgi:lipopolysaccharide transport system ATP-binding protein
MSDVAIRVEGLSKRHRIGARVRAYKTLRESLTAAASAGLNRARSAFRRRGDAASAGDAPDTFWALKDVSFEVNRGEAVGVIGRNGAGKSTLLKILSRITEPTEGFVDLHGRVGSLLEVGTGFHPELTGRENIFLNGAILGMRRADIDRRFDEIVAFADVERFIDTPVKHYSSGMYLRLAFAVAAHLEPEILVVDEVLAVGDSGFQRKCLGKMQKVADEGRTVLFVSHDMTAMSHLTSRVIWLDQGRVEQEGRTGEVIFDYAKQKTSGVDVRHRRDRQGDGSIRIDSLALLDEEGNEVGHVATGETLIIALGYRSEVEEIVARDLWLDLRFTDPLNAPVATFSTRFAPTETVRAGGTGTLTCTIPRVMLASEVYGIDLWLAYRGGVCDAVWRAGEVAVVTSNYFGTGSVPIRRKHGAAVIDHSWSVGSSAPASMSIVTHGERDV